LDSLEIFFFHKKMCQLSDEECKLLLCSFMDFGHRGLMSVSAVQQCEIVSYSVWEWKAYVNSINYWYYLVLLVLLLLLKCTDLTDAVMKILQLS